MANTLHSCHQATGDDDQGPQVRGYLGQQGVDHPEGDDHEEQSDGDGDNVFVNAPIDSGEGQEDRMGDVQT